MTVVFIPATHKQATTCTMVVLQGNPELYLLYDTL